MDREGLEKESRLHSLEAENKHLKSLLNRIVIPKNKLQTDSSSFLAGRIEQLLSDDWQYKEVISIILKELGIVVGADRVSIFSYNVKKEIHSASSQWVNDNVQEYHPSDLTYTKKENPLNNPNCNGCFVSSNISKDIEQSLAEKLETFQVQSILIIPFEGAGYSNGMIVFESCQFNREWYDFEVIEITNTIKFISSYLTSLRHKNNAEQAYRLGKLRNKTYKNLKAGKKTKKAVNEVLEKLGIELGFNSIYIVEKGNYSKDHEVQWAKANEFEENCLSNTELEKLQLKFDKKLCFYLTHKELSNGGLDSDEVKRSVLISGINVNNEFKGWLVGEPGFNNFLFEELLIQFWESIGNTISEAFTVYTLDVELNAKKHKLQEASHQLAFKDTFLNNVLNYSPFGIVIVKGGLVKYANQQFADVIGYKQEELINQKASILHNFAEDNEEELASQFYSNIEEGGQATEEITIANKFNQQKRISLFGSKGTEEKGSYLIFTLDITERYFAKKEIQESRTRYQKILESTVDGVIILNKDGLIHFVNQSFCDLLGYSYDDAKLLRYTDFIYEEHIPIFEDVIMRLDQGSDFKGDSILRKKIPLC